MGKCRHDLNQYELMASNFRLRNVKWKDQYLYAARTWFMEQLRTTVYKGKYADTWNLYRVPGPTWTPYGAQIGAMGDQGTISHGAGLGYLINGSRYILSPVEFPEFAAAIANNKARLSIPVGGDKNHDPDFYIKVGSMYAVDLYHLTHRHLAANRFPFDPSLIFNDICRPQNAPTATAIEINGMFGTASWYVHTASWLVYGWVWSDPSEGGYWEMEDESGKSIDIQFPICQQVSLPH